MAVDGRSQRRWPVILAMTGSLSMIMFDSTVLGVALPTISRDLSLSATMQAWSVNGFLLAMAACVAIGGRLGDRIGRMRAFRIGMFGFMLASIGCAAAPTGELFIAARIAQGLCAALMQPASAAIVIDVANPARRGVAMATYAGISLLFLAAGPVIGGVLVESTSWAWCFLVNVPIVLAALATTFGLPPLALVHFRRPLDGLSVLLLPTSMLLVTWALQQDTRGATDTVARWVIAAIGAVLTILFIRRQWTIATPLIDLRLFRDRALRANALLLMGLQVVTVGQGIYGSIYMQECLQFTPLEAGIGSLPLLLPVLLLVHVAGRMYDKSGPRTPILSGLLLVMLGASVETYGIAISSYAVLGVGMALLGAGCGLAMSPTNVDALSRAPADRRGEVAGLVQQMRQLGSTLGITMMVLVMQCLSSGEIVGTTGLTLRGIACAFGLHIAVAAACLVLAFRSVREKAPVTKHNSGSHPSTPTT
jgi:EmrB/QacA subfamily drug resistance transporter